MRKFQIEAMTIEANTKKEAVEKYIKQHFITFMSECEKSYSTLYKITKQVN